MGYILNVQDNNDIKITICKELLGPILEELIKNYLERKDKDEKITTNANDRALIRGFRRLG